MKIAVAIVQKDQKFLLIRRHKTEGNLVWSFPGGKQEFRENITQTAIRETREETGISVEVEFKLGHRIHPDTGVETTYFFCSWQSGEICNERPEEIDEIRWCSKDELLNLITSNIYPPILKYLNSL